MASQHVRQTAHLPDVMDLIVTPLLVPGHLLAINHENSVSAAQVYGLGSYHSHHGPMTSASEYQSTFEVVMVRTSPQTSC